MSQRLSALLYGSIHGATGPAGKQLHKGVAHRDIKWLCGRMNIVAAALDLDDTREKLAASIVSVARQMNMLGLNQGTSGNVSARLGKGFLITPSGVAYESLRPEDVVSVGSDGTIENGKRPSSEWRMHRDIYASRAEAGGVVHAHPTYCTALSCLREDIPPFHYMVAMAGGVNIRCANYATFGSQELSDAMRTALLDRCACLLANHGMICFATDIEAALALGIEVETLARHYCESRKMGEPVLLSQKEMADVLERFQTYGG